MSSPYCKFHEHLRLDWGSESPLGQIFLGLLHLWGLEGVTPSWVLSPPVSPWSLSPTGGRAGSLAQTGYLAQT